MCTLRIRDTILEHSHFYLMHINTFRMSKLHNKKLDKFILIRDLVGNNITVLNSPNKIYSSDYQRNYKNLFRKMAAIYFKNSTLTHIDIFDILESINVQDEFDDLVLHELNMYNDNVRKIRFKENYYSKKALYETFYNIRSLVK